ncbi:MAG: MraY family glycosyltransferase [Planctomycetota bacterium]
MAETARRHRVPTPVLVALLAAVLVVNYLGPVRGESPWFVVSFAGIGFCTSALLGAILVRHPWPWLGVDDPAGNPRKLQERPIPTVGIALLVLPCLLSILPEDLGRMQGRKPWLLAISFVILLVIGWNDDAKGKRVSWKLKLGMQVLVLVVLMLGFFPDFGYFGPDQASGFCLLLLCGLLILNAWNVFDHADGIVAAAALGTLLCLIIPGLIHRADLYVLGVGGRPGQPLFPQEGLTLMLSYGPVLTLLCGALAGFLIWNFPRARLYMGDQGTHALGFFMMAVVCFNFGVLHAVEIEHPGNWGTPKWQVMLPSMLLPSLIPVLDLCQVSVRRILARTPPWRGDRRHLAHVLAAWGLGPRWTVVLVFVLQFASLFLLSRIR